MKPAVQLSLGDKTTSFPLAERAMLLALPHCTCIKTRQIGRAGSDTIVAILVQHGPRSVGAPAIRLISVEYSL